MQMKILQTLHVLNATETHSTLSISYFISFFWSDRGDSETEQMPASTFSLHPRSSASPLPCQEWIWSVLWWFVFGGPGRWAWCPVDQLPSLHHHYSGRILNTAYWQIWLLMLIMQHNPTCYYIKRLPFEKNKNKNWKKVGEFHPSSKIDR